MTERDYFFSQQIKRHVFYCGLLIQRFVHLLKMNVIRVGFKD